MFPDPVVCPEDGGTFGRLRRHVRNTRNPTPDRHRERRGPPSDHPMVAPA